MQCMSCQSEINPQWKHAIDNNMCPFCGKIILPEQLKSLFSSLRETMEELKANYLDQLDDWLLSNFKYVRIDGPKIEGFYPKQEVIYKEIKVPSHSSDKEPEIESSNLPGKEIASKFFKNAGVSGTVGRTQEFKKMVEQIKSNQPELSAYQHQSSEMTEDDLQESTYSSESYDEAIPPQVLAFANGKKDPSYNVKDMLRLQQLNQRTADSRNNVINGTGGRGSFSRSG